MKVRVVRASDWDHALDAVWAKRRDLNPALHSAFFHPEFTHRVGSVRNNVEIAVLEEANEIIGFFPYERKTPHVGVPVGGILSDYHGVIAAADVPVDPQAILRGCGLSAWDFSHVPKSQSVFSTYAHYEIPSPCIDLSMGYEFYVRRQKESGSEAIKQTERRQRRLVRELGELRFVADDASPSAFDQVLRWKSEQYRKTGSPDLFTETDAGAILRAMSGASAPGFRGILSTIYVGDKLLAGHFGIMSEHHWHYWFPSYAASVEQYSPGLILLLKMAEYAPTIGIDLIDLGGGMARYKQSLMTHSTSLLGGSVERPSWLSLGRSMRRGSVAFIKNSPVAGPARSLLRTMRAMAKSSHRARD